MLEFTKVFCVTKNIYWTFFNLNKFELIKVQLFTFNPVAAMEECISLPLQLIILHDLKIVFGLFE